MPYKTLKQDCKRSDGKQGRYILKVKPKPGKYKGRKRDSKGFVRIGCHPSKDSASKQLAAIEAPPREGVSMKITAGQLRQIIKEELGSLNEQHIPQDMLERLNSAMMSIAEYVMDKYDDDSAEGIAETEAILTDELNGFMESLEDMAMSRPPGDDLKPAPDNDMDVDNDGMISADELSDEIEDIRDDL